jgi:phosphate transport system substrate-binding protein
MRSSKQPILWVAAAAAAGLLAAGCKSDETAVKGAVEGGASLTGKVMVDGSSTVFPVFQAVAEEFMKSAPKVNVTVAESGTGGGFKKFANGEIDITGASRPISEEEIAACKAKGVEFVEVPVAFDGLSVVVNPANTWVDTLTVAELKKIWEPRSSVKTWADVRVGFPAKPIKLFGPGSDSGTFEYFTEAIVGEKKASRQDFQQSEDDNILVQGVAGEEGALGYFGLAYYLENSDKLKLVKVDNGSGGVAPSPETVNDGSYAPLSRPIFVYVAKSALQRPEVKAFLEYFLSAEGRELVEAVGYVPLPAKAYELAEARVAGMTTGSVFSGRNTAGMKIEDVLQAPK